MQKSMTRQLVPGVILGLLSGVLLAPMLMGMLLATVMASPFVLIPSVVAAVLGAWAGWPALAAATLSCLAAGYSLGGAVTVLITAEVVLLPAWGTYLILGKRPRFYEGVAQSAFLQFGALVVLLMGAWLVLRQDLAQYFAGQLRLLVDALSWNDIVATYRIYAQAIGQNPGALGALTPQEGARLLDQWFASYASSLQQNMPQMLLGSGLITGALGYWLSARVLARRGDDPPVSYAHPRDWFLLPHLIVGPPACAVACYIAFQLGMAGADAGYLAMAGLSNLLFTVQGLGAVDRLLFRTGASRTRRNVTLVVMTLIFQLALPIIGLASALMGSKGLISTWLKKRAQSKDKGGDGR